MLEQEFGGKLLLEANDDGVAVLTLNRPEKINALDMEMRLGLPVIAERVRQDDKIKVLIITGAGRGFCSGADVNVQAANAFEKPKKTRRETLNTVGWWMLPLLRVEKPSIAAVNGAAMGIGLTMTLVCDVRIAAEQAKFGSLWVNRGLVPDGGATYLLPRIIGMSRALELMYAGSVIDAREADRIGLVSRVVSADELMPAAIALAMKWAKGPSVAIELIKKAVYSSVCRECEAQMDYESYAQGVAYQTEDHKEAVKAFLEKRPPVYKGI
ncbi:MAG: enoyl-CoA hydratase-related protein [Dehalococcoidales bacterium]|nr:enoyl-CoA hydratase-related protein [Dehalococcoidales bacterium]